MKESHEESGITAMDHKEALRIKAAEQYVLDEMDSASRDAFEAHFFSCPECAADTLAATRLADGIQKHGASTAVAPARPSWLSGWTIFRPQWSAYAAAALALIVVYQNAVSIPGLQRDVREASRPAVLQTFDLTGLGSRALPEKSIEPDPSSPYVLLVSIPPGSASEAYEVSVTDGRGEERLRVPVTADEAQDTVLIHVPPRTLAPGKHTLRIHSVKPDGSRQDVAAHDFAVK